MLIDIQDDFINLLKLRFPDEDITKVVNDSLFVIRDKTIEGVRDELRRNGVGTLVLTDCGNNLINAIKCVRQYTGLGLKEAKDLCDLVKGGKPQSFINKNMTFKDAENRYTLADFAKSLQDCGARFRYAADPRDIAAVRMKYGVYGPEILSGMFD